MQMKYYAVKVGRNVGIYSTWEECKQQVDGFSNAQFKSFTPLQEAKKYLSILDDKNTEDTFCRIYVDGSYDKVSKCYSYGMVVLYKNQELHFNELFCDEAASMHNVAGEIKGACKAFDYCIENGISYVELYYDYAGIEKWALCHWKANKPETKQYQLYYQEISKLLKVEFKKVKSHTNNHYNDVADQLAKEALK